MTRTALIVLFGLMLVAPAAGRPVPDRTSAELIVGFREGVSASEQRQVLAAFAGRVERRFGRIDGVLASLPAGRAAEARQRLERDPRVEYAEPNVVLRTFNHGDPGDGDFHELWGLHNFGQPVAGVAGTPDADIDALEAWQVSQGSSNVVVGVIDSGVDYTHPDLSSQVWTNPGEDCAGCRANGVDDDGNGYVDDWRGWDFANDDNDPMDDNGHGTHVAGTIGARQDAQGVVGVSWRVRIMPLKFIGANGEGTAADALRAILYAASMGAQITNNSYGGDGFSQAMLDAIEAADASGSLFVAAAGNNFNDNDANPTYPASYDAPNVVSVAASDQFDRRAWFSNYGTETVDLAAPGTNVYSTWPGGGYRHSDGTSMAAPQVVGAAALARAAFPDASAVGLKALLLRTIDGRAALQDAVRTGGRLNVDNAVRCSDRARVWIDSPAAGFEARAGEPLPIRVLATRCAEVAGVSTDLTVNGLPIELTARGDGLFTGSYTPPAAAGLTLVASATAAGGSDSHTVSGMAVQHQSIVPGGAPVRVTTTTPGENALLSFPATEGQRIALKVSDVSVGTSPCCSLRISFLSAGGPEWLPPVLFGTKGGFIDTKTIPQDGIYRILVDPQGSDVGSLTLTLYDVPPDATASISPGGPPVTLTAGPVPGQNALFSFSGLAGQRVSLRVSSVTIGTSTCCSAKVLIQGLGTPTLFGTNGVFVDTKVLPADGPYTVLVDPVGTDTGSATVELFDVPPDPVAFASPGGPPITVSAGSVPGQNSVVQFSGLAGQRVAVKASGVTIGTTTCCSFKLSIQGLGSAVLMGRNGGLLDTLTLPESGAYSILVDPQGMDAGAATLTIYDVPPDVTGSIVPGGAPVAVSTSSLGQNAAVTFAGEAGRRVSLKLSGVTIGTSTCCSAKVSIAKPDGSTLVTPTLFGRNGGFVDTKTLPVSGTYTILVDPQGADVGSATLQLYEVPADLTGSLTVGGAPASLTFSTPGQNAVLTFAGAAVQRVTIRATAVTIGPSTCCSVSLVVRKPDGVPLASGLAGTNGGTLSATLPVAGTYTLVVDPQGAAVGSASVTASS
ncbi:MAG TPA: S8 family peptidase [Gaiellaceae bacterium]|nr:S8 family peptidase [Gaiellaceae bacterium]